MRAKNSEKKPQPQRKAYNQDYASDPFGNLNQFGNPMVKDTFEEKLCYEEAAERRYNREKYIEGIQGRDGGEWHGN